MSTKKCPQCAETVGADAYYLTGIKRVKSEGQQRGFLPGQRAKNIENVVGCLGLLHNRYVSIAVGFENSLPLSVRIYHYSDFSTLCNT